MPSVVAFGWAWLAEEGDESLVNDLAVAAGVIAMHGGEASALSAASNEAAPSAERYGVVVDDVNVTVVE